MFLYHFTLGWFFFLEYASLFLSLYHLFLNHLFDILFPTYIMPVSCIRPYIPLIFGSNEICNEHLRNKSVVKFLYRRYRIERYCAQWHIEPINTFHIGAIEFAYSYNSLDLINTIFNSLLQISTTGTNFFISELPLSFSSREFNISKYILLVMWVNVTESYWFDILMFRRQSLCSFLGRPSGMN